MDYDLDRDMIDLDFTYPNNGGGSEPWDFIVNGVNIFKTYPDLGDGLYFTDGRARIHIYPEDYKTGTNTIQIVYPGDQEHPAEEAYFEFNLERQDAGISVDDIDDAEAGLRITITITGPDDAYGYVTLTIDSEEYEGLFEDGRVDIEIEGLSRGTHTANIYYSGDTIYNPYNTSIDINVE